MTPEEEKERQLQWHREQIWILERAAAGGGKEEEATGTCTTRSSPNNFQIPSPALMRGPSVVLTTREQPQGCHNSSKFTSTCKRWPRSSSCLFGVVLPLFGLIGLCMAFGLLVAHYEAPYEIQSNDAKMQSKTNANMQLRVLQLKMRVSPQACFSAFVLNQTSPKQAEDHITKILVNYNRNHTEKLNDLKEQVYDILLHQTSESLDRNNSNTTTTQTDLYDWMSACGKVVEATGMKNIARIREDFTRIDGDLTFNWIRCVPGASGIDDGFDVTSKAFGEKQWIPILWNQSNYYHRAWNENQAQVREKLTRLYQDRDGMILEQASRASWYASLEEASGGSVCELNPAAGGWFWFTVLSTMGYGNQAPNTPEGRAIVYTLGFVSIVLFGFILGVAGLVTSAVADDFLARWNTPLLTTPGAQCLIWCCMYYGWMTITAAVVLAWKHDRLQQDTAEAEQEFSFQDGYWFAYISSTTVGLGDIYLEPLVLQSSDMITFPFLFLVNFVFVSAFLSKLGELCGAVFRVSLVEQLLEHLEKTNTYRQKKKALKQAMGCGTRMLDVPDDLDSECAGEEEDDDDEGNGHQHVARRQSW